jgi:hypothetical protein
MAKGKQVAPPTSSTFDQAVTALRAREAELGDELAAVEEAIARRDGLRWQLEAVQAALGTLVPPTKPAAKRRSAETSKRPAKRERLAEVIDRVAAARAAKAKPAATVEREVKPGLGRRSDVSDEDFIRVWNASERSSDVDKHFGKSNKWATKRAIGLRHAGRELRQLATGRPKSKPAADAEERPAVVEVTPLKRTQVCADGKVRGVGRRPFNDGGRALYRCKTSARCGAVVAEAKREDHLVEVHGITLNGTHGLAKLFEGPLPDEEDLDALEAA